MSSDKDATVTHCLGGCGKVAPEKPSRAGWRRGRCSGCYASFIGYTSTEAVRRWRSNPENREKDREAARRWKREHLGQPGQPKAT